MQSVQPKWGKLIRLFLFLVFAVFFIFGCGGKQHAAKKSMAGPYVAPTVKISGTRAVEDGSLWQDSGCLSAMFADIKARKVGDILTIKIVESSSATNKASTKTERDSSFDAGISNFFNAEKRFPSDQPFFNPFSKVAGYMKSGFDGSGTTKRSGDLTAYMTARVIQVLDNGNLVIEGNREVRVNDENQIITLTGVVRPRDISANNVIRSTYVADARISYSGSGIINEKQKPGWLSRLLNKVWPF